eukprot:2461991-Rhodomonas_salina.1
MQWHAQAGTRVPRALARVLSFVQYPGDASWRRTAERRDMEKRCTRTLGAANASGGLGAARLRLA